MSGEQCPHKAECDHNCLDPFTMTDECLSYLTLQEKLWYWDFIGIITPFQDRRPPDEINVFNIGETAARKLWPELEKAIKNGTLEEFL